MDQKLLAWGLRPSANRLPRLWLFTDHRRLPDPLPAARNLPRGKAGIIFRHDGVADRLSLGIELARICRQRRLPLVVAGDAHLAAKLGAGLHLRGGRFPASRPCSPRPRNSFLTSSAHSVADLLRARRAGASLAFLSPAFSTNSHPGAGSLGALRWGLTARRAPKTLAIGALGGVDGYSVHRLPQRCIAVGAIGALSA